MTKILRPHQEKAINEVSSNLEQGIDKQLLVMATGTGKTFTAANIMKGYKKILWVTHNIELINQSAGVMRDFGFLTGIIKQERMEIHQRVVVASIQTLCRRLEKIHPDTFDMMVIDEAHFAAARTWTNVFNHFNCKLKLGLTATPHRSDGMPLGDLFDKIVYEYSILDGIKDGFLCEIKAHRVRTQISLDKVRTTAGEFNSKDLRIIDCPERNNLIVDKYLEYAEGRPALTFCVDVEHAINLSETFNRRGLNSTFVVGDKNLCPDREHRISLFKSGEIEVMNSVMVLVYGFDYPNLACIIAACPTKSLTKYMQLLGHGLRLKEDYNECVIIDVVDVTTRHQLINTWTLDKDKKAKDKLFLTKEEKGIAIEREKKELEEEELTTKDKEIDLFAIPAIKKDYYTPAYKEAATDKQLSWIESLGYDIEKNNYTKGMASKIIDGLPATDKQIHMLAYKGYNVSGAITRGEAQSAFTEINEKSGKVPSWKRSNENPVVKASTDKKVFRSMPDSPFKDL